MHRTQIARETDEIGLRLNQLKDQLLQNNYTYTAGMARAAAEILTILHAALDDQSVPESEL